MYTQEMLQSLINQCDLPSHKKDISRSTNLLWVVDNLHVRNRSHACYSELKSAVVALARQRNLMTEKAAKAALTK